MGRKKAEKALGIKDIVAFATSGWTPTEVNALLDRMDEIGDVTAPDVKDDEDEETDEDTSAEDATEDLDDEGEDESDEDEDDEDEDSSKETKSKKKTSDSLSLLENENKRLKKQLEKLQAKNRSKDVSGGKDEKPIEQSLIDTFQSLFD